MAYRDRLAVPGQLREAPGEVPEGDQMRSSQVGHRKFPWFAHIENERSRGLLQCPCKRQSLDLDRGTGIGELRRTAPGFVVDQFGQRRMVAAHDARRITSH